MSDGGTVQKAPEAEKMSSANDIRFNLSLIYIYFLCTRQTVPSEFLSGGERADCG